MPEEVTPDTHFSVPCFQCGEKLWLERYNGKATPPFPNGWWADAVHDHVPGFGGEEGVWRIVVYYREPGGRFPVPAKYVRALQKENLAHARILRQVKNDSRPKRGGTGG